MPTAFPTSLDSFVNPGTTDKLNGNLNPPVLHTTQHSNHNDSISAIEQKLGIDFSAVSSSVDFGLRVIEQVWMTHPAGGYKETSYISTAFPSQIIWFTDSSKTIKLIEKNISYGPANKKFVTQLEWKLYDGTASNTLKRTIIDSITRNGAFEVSRTRTIT